MRTLLVALLAVAAVLLGGCGSDAPSVAPVQGGEVSRLPLLPHSAVPATPSAPPSSQTQPDASGSPACKQVVKGIDAFNRGVYTSTIRHFKKAVPLAKAALEDDDSPAAQDLLDAVLYYATLTPRAYPVAAGNSELFAKFKQITLEQCVPIGSAPAPAPASPTDPGVPI